MQLKRAALLCLLTLPLLHGCSPSAAPAGRAADSATAAAPATVVAAAPAVVPAAVATVADAPVPGGPGRACNRVTANEMSAITGMPMQAAPNDSTEGITSCTYSPVAGTGPRIEYTISAGDGASTLRMGREMKNYDPAPGKAFAGIGEDADVIGRGLVINDHGDMVSLSLSGIGLAEEPAIARKIYDAAQGGGK